LNASRPTLLTRQKCSMVSSIARNVSSPERTMLPVAPKCSTA
jgi:hypothetical protein